MQLKSFSQQHHHYKIKGKLRTKNLDCLQTK